MQRWYTLPKTVTHPSTNWAQGRVTSFMRQTTLPPCQTAMKSLPTPLKTFSPGGCQTAISGGVLFCLVVISFDDSEHNHHTSSLIIQLKQEQVATIMVVTARNLAKRGPYSPDSAHAPPLKHRSSLGTHETINQTTSQGL